MHFVPQPNVEDSNLKSVLWFRPYSDKQRRQRRNNSDSEEIQESTEEDEGSEGWTDYLIRDFTSAWNQEPWIPKFEEDGSPQDGEAAM